MGAQQKTGRLPGKSGLIQNILLGLLVAVTMAGFGVVAPTSSASAATPQDVSVRVGEEARFDATSDVAGATYQWFFKHPTMANFAPAGESTATSPILVIPGSSVVAGNDGVQFRATITYPGGSTSQTPPATLRIVAATVTSQPSSVTAVVGQQVTFTAGFDSPNATVRWYYKHPSMAGFAPAGESTATSRTLVLPGTSVIAANSGVQFKAVFTLAGQTFETTPATLTVTQDRSRKIGLLEIPFAARTVNEGVGVAFGTSIDRTGVTVQWLYKHPSMPAFAAVGETPQTSYSGGRTISTLTLPPAAVTMANNGVQFKVIITAGADVFESNVAQLTIKPRPAMNDVNCASLACGVSIITEYASRVVRDSRDPNYTRLVTKMSPGVEGQAWRIDADARADGSVRFINVSNGQCMASTESRQWAFDKQYGVDLVNCSNSDYAKWYFQPQPGSDKYAIRNVATNECLDVRGSSSSDFTPMQTHPCKVNEAAQRFTLTNTSTDAISSVMTSYAMKMCDAGTAGVSCAYENLTEAAATLARPVRVSDLYFNGTTRDSSFSLNWSASKTIAQTFSYTYSVGATLGWAITGGPTASVTVTQAYGYAKAWWDATTEGSSVDTTIAPGEYGWITRAQLTKALKGTWTMTTSLGTSWTAEGTTTIPAKAGTDGQSSVIITCSSNSTLKACTDTAPSLAYIP